MILSNWVDILMLAQKCKSAEEVLQKWTMNMESSGYKIYITTPFILLGEVYLYLQQTSNAIIYFQKAGNYGATRREFKDKPSFYYEIAKKFLTNEVEIENLFQSQQTKNTSQEKEETILEKIKKLCIQGNNLYDAENYSKAIEIWKQALHLVPNPQNTYEESQWLEASIGDAYFMMDKFEDALFHMQNAKGNIQINAYENPFIMLRLGQSFYENQNFEEGKEIFREENKKYLNFLLKNIDEETFTKLLKV